MKKNNSYKCQYCKKNCKTFRVFSLHSATCVIKDRIELCDTPNSILGHKLWCESFKGTSRKDFSFATFCNHSDYHFFMNLANFCENIHAISSIDYMNWCIKEKLKFKFWTTDSAYIKFVKHFILHEDPVSAVIRSLQYIENIKKSFLIKEYFAVISPGVFLNSIEMGRISPWLLLLSNQTYKILGRLSKEQRCKYDFLVDKSIWSILEKRYINECFEIQSVLKNELL